MADAINQGAEDDVFSFESTANKEFPLAPQGVHDVTVARALHKLRDPFKKKDGGPAKEHVVQLMLQSTQTYKDDSGAEKPYNLFRTMKISDHPQSGMFELFRDVMGMPVPLMEVTKPDGTKAKRIHFLPPKIEKVEDGEDLAHMTQFEGLKFQIVVKHEDKEDGSGKKRDTVDSIIPCSAEQQAANAKLFQSAQG